MPGGMAGGCHRQMDARNASGTRDRARPFPDPRKHTAPPFWMDATWMPGNQITAAYQITATAAAMKPRTSARLGICCTSAAITAPGRSRKKRTEHYSPILERRNVTPLPEFYLTLSGIKELRLVLAPRGKYNICRVWPDANEDPKKIINGP